MATLLHFHSHLFSYHHHHHTSNPLSLFLQYPSCSCYSLTHNIINNNKPLFYQSRQPTALCLATSKKTRPSGKLISDADLCDKLREFVAAVGLPEGHVPSTKELTEHGRKDLANLVRRRGHQYIRELLANSSGRATVSLEDTNDELNVIHSLEPEGQEKKLNDVIQESTGGPLTGESSAICESSVSKHETAFSLENDGHKSSETTVSLQERVENFMKYGQLEAVEDDLFDDAKLKGAVEGNSSSSVEKVVDSDRVKHHELDSGHSAGFSNNAGLNGTLTAQRLATDKNVSGDLHLPSQGQLDDDFDNDANIEASKLENEVEMNHLKQMLSQKELELSRLKEEIEKEKHALSVLQSRAESEIRKAQKLISEKDAELNAAEESLSGLVEAKILYSGEGQSVEVAGSFNGWHQRIKMDPDSSSVTVDPIGSRKARLWSTTLWLYPGVYEMKFIVDGQWQIDPQRESTMKGGMENNVLRVDR